MQKGDHKPELESMAVNLSPADPAYVTWRLASRGGRPERECCTSSMQGRAIEELQPRAQRFTDARKREALRVLDLEADVAALRPVAVEIDLRKLFIAGYKRRHPDVKGRALCLAIDNAELEPLPTWVTPEGTRLWVELWAHPLTKNAVRKFISSVRRT
jgi:hypothetical protein